MPIYALVSRIEDTDPRGLRGTTGLIIRRTSGVSTSGWDETSAMCPRAKSASLAKTLRKVILVADRGQPSVHLKCLEDIDDE